MRIGVYPVGLHVLGGGEKYIGKIAEVLSKEHKVAFIVFGEPNLDELENRMNIDLCRVTVDRIWSPVSFFQERMPVILSPLNSYQVSKRTERYDVFINQEHMTFIPSRARRSILICEVPPVRRTTYENIWGRLLFDHGIRTYDYIVVNSFFTKTRAEKYYGRPATVLYPPVDTDAFVPREKQRLILSVGRFSTFLHCKKQLELVKAFRQLYYEQDLAGWEYHLVGKLGGSAKDRSYLRACEREARGLPIFFHIDASFSLLKNLYARAKIFWHATGLGEDENAHPERMEHFGIATVEAMAAGCVPVVMNGGGQPEIVHSGVTGFVFETLEELKQYTIRLMESEALCKQMSEESVKRSQEFSIKKFESKVLDVFDFNSL